MKISDNNLAAVLESLTPAERRVVEDCARAARFTSNETIELLRRAITWPNGENARDAPRSRSAWLVNLLPGTGMALLPSPSPKNRACCFHRTRLKHFKRPLRRTRYSNRSFLRDQSAGAIAYDRLDASPPDWPSNRHHRSPPRHGDASASRFPG